MKKIILFTAASLLLAAVLFAPAAAQQPAPNILIPMGGGYSDLYTGMMQTVVQNPRNGQVNILILPATYSSDPVSITEGERQVNMQDAERRRFEVEEACKRAAPADVTCSAIIAPVFTRADAADPATLSLFTPDLSAIFILGGDQTVAMQIIIGTPLEARLDELYRSGVIVSGTSAGCGMQSYNMLGGYESNFAAGTSLQFGAADVWNSPERHGLTFGVQTAIIDQHFFQRSRFGRLLNAISLPGVPHVGIGVDGYTALHIREGRTLGDVFGLYGVAVLDAETYHAADGARFVPLADSPETYILSVRNVLVHLLAQGDNTYDLETRQHSLGAPQPFMERSFETLTPPEGAGTLILSGYLGKNPAGSPILERFIAVSGGQSARILIVAAGFKSGRSAQTNAETLADALGVPTEIIALGDDSPDFAVPAGITGIIFTGLDPSKINAATLAPITEAWLAGTPVLADNAAAALLGAYYSNHGPTPDETDLAEIATQKSFILGITQVQPGLGLLDIIVEPRVLDDNRWGRLFSVLHAHPQQIGVGLNDGTALEISSGGATVLGDDGIFIFDLRAARVALGSNDGLVIANALLDVYAPGETVAPITADVEAAYPLQPLPVLSTPTPSPEPTATPIPATDTPLPTEQPTAPAAPTPGVNEAPANTPGWVWWSAPFALVAVFFIYLYLQRNAGKQNK